jgi:heme/copper-type cytochrome/quinol oxidase subunit 2
MSRPRRSAGVLLGVGAVACLAAFSGYVSAGLQAGAGPHVEAGLRPGSAQDAQAGEARTFTVVARKYSYSEPRLEVRQNDLVKITFEAADIPHSFTIDEPYRIAKRAAPDHPVVFEFRADKVGTFDFYCNLKVDDGCRKMKGQLVVTAR